MPVYTVHAPSFQSPSGRGARRHADDVTFVRDGFHVWAMLLGPFWMLAHRLWLVLIGYLALLAALGSGLHAAGAGGAWDWSFVLLQILVGLEAGTLRRWTLARRRRRQIGLVVADDLEAAERRFFDREVENPDAAESAAAAPAPAPFAAPTRPVAGESVVGLFPEAGAPR